MKHIQNIIFDLGGVIIDIDYDRPVKELAKLGIHGIESIFSVAEPDPMYHRYETGKIDTETFFMYLKNKSQLNLSFSEIRTAWDSILTGLEKEKIHRLQLLKEKYNVFLLSNINESHIEGVELIFQSYFPEQHLEDYMHQVYYSCRIGKRKPDVDTFQFILKDQHIVHSSTIMIDDSKDNIKGAALAGLHTYHISPLEGRSFYTITDQLLS